MKLEKNLFDLSSEESDLSKMMYNGKIVKCLVAPYHTQRNLEMDYAENIFMFPEKELTQNQTKQFISMIVNSKFDEVLIITAEMNIILDMVDACVRILTERDEIIHSPEKTFGANPHTIIYCVLNNDEHKISKSEKTKSHKEIERYLAMINDNDTITRSQFNEISDFIDKIGEQLIADRMRDMLNHNVRVV